MDALRECTVFAAALGLRVSVPAVRDLAAEMGIGIVNDVLALEAVHYLQGAINRRRLIAAGQKG